MNLRKIGFFILMVSIVGNSKTAQVEENQGKEKALSLHVALWHDTLKIEGEQISCSDYSDEKKIHKIKIENLQKFFRMKPIRRGEELSFSKTDYLRNSAYSADYLQKFISNLDNYIDILNIDLDSDEEFEKKKKELIESFRRSFKEGKRENQWEGFWTIFRKDMKKTKEKVELIRDYLEKKAESDEERKEISQEMTKRVIENWERLRNAVLAGSPDIQEIIESLKLPRELNQLPELVTFKKSLRYDP